MFEYDAVLVLSQCIQKLSLDAIQIFFHNPWPNRRHHPRRLIQKDFLSLLKNSLKPKGQLHLATDWQDYAFHMMKVISQDENFTNLYGSGEFSGRSKQRPLVTKFEQRAIQEGRKIWDLCFENRMECRLTSA